MVQINAQKLSIMGESPIVTDEKIMFVCQLVQTKK